jgi:2-polyprenyl-3-methyl-5-hydroxy-6-metoxy-1,4-benzoquinol methylase
MSWWRPARSDSQELLDTPGVSEQELAENLQDLQRLNTCLGSTRIVLAAVRRLWQEAGSPPRWRVLDVGTGAGDIPTALMGWSRKYHICLTMVATDVQRQVIHYAQTVTPPSVSRLQADGCWLPFQARTFDVVVCSTMLHHLEWTEGVALLRAMAIVARHGVVVNDLIRSWVHYYGAKFLLPLLARNRLTLHDGPLSVLRAYSPQEVRDMAQIAGLYGARVDTRLHYRLLLVYRIPTERRTICDP